MNTAQQNIEGLDLIDDVQKIIVQVSADISKRKIESSLCKENLAQYTNYRFKFIGITNSVKNLRSNTFLNPHNILFDPQQDIFDIKMILKNINDMKDVEKIKRIYDFIQKEIKMPITQERVETNIARIIEIISQTDLERRYKPETIPFDIEKKISFNKLVNSQSIINSYKQYYTTIDKIYTEFDKIGNNKSLSVLNSLKTLYIKNANIDNPDDCFYQIIKDEIDYVKKSSNYAPVPDEELNMYVGIITVDAFIRCKIFKNPEVV
jgi:hypothetical protein